MAVVLYVSMAIDKFDKEPDIYVLPDVNELAEGVSNLFMLAGNLDLKAPMEFPEGKYNVRCTMEEISKSPKAMEITAKAIKLATNFDLAPGQGMWDMMKTMKPEDMANMAGSMMPEGFVESLNAQLIQISRED